MNTYFIHKAPVDVMLLLQLLVQAYTCTELCKINIRIFQLSFLNEVITTNWRKKKPTGFT